MTRLDGKRILEISWELLHRDQRDFLLAAKASQGSAIFVDGGKRGLSVGEAICLEELCGPKYAGHIAVAVFLEPGCACRLQTGGFFCWPKQKCQISRRFLVKR